MQSADQKSQVTSRTVWIVGLNVLAILAISLVLYLTRQEVVAVILALFLAVAINPAISRLEKKKMKRGLAVLIVFAAGTLFLAVLITSFLPLFVEQGVALVNAAPQMVEKLSTHSLVQWADQQFGLVVRAREGLKAHAGELATSALGLLTSFFKTVFSVITVLVLTIFMLIFGQEIINKWLESVEPARRDHYLQLAGRMQKTVGGYVAGTLLIASIGGIVAALTLIFLGVPYFLPLGLAMVLLGIIPYIGPTLGAVLVVGTTFATAGSTPGIISAIVFVIYQVIENNLLQPLIQTRTIKMNPLIIVVVVLFGTSLAGILGAILALPFAGAAQVILQDIMFHRKESDLAE